MTVAAVTITLESVTDMHLCEEGIVVANKVLPASGHLTFAQSRDAGASLDDLVWVAAYMAFKDQDVDRRLRLWMADCAARVLHVYEKTEPSDAPRNAIIAARQFHAEALTPLPGPLLGPPDAQPRRISHGPLGAL